MVDYMNKFNYDTVLSVHYFQFLEHINIIFQPLTLQIL